MRSLALPVLLSVLWAQPSSAQPSMCGAGASDASLAGSLTQAATVLRQRCRPGEVIILPVSMPGLIGLACDFTKSMVNTGRDVICVFAPRENR